ncbi:MULTISPECIES: nucleoid occlusion protein [unclassified Halanaerobium]|uniref:nucleoid occlusion protein n=1 Tax=unclassified Halanaerobium TaxID=2641197 RepID=UPI000DF13C01|nr:MULTISPECIES: nucleoid occlusion protein [unclassified Halanaerobium]RCW41458.1 ParB family chromosome partitioning protein [Halanaerobium sp. MA284_MarDTE_T2]RCW79732.1 ParB family chromosome partitioning protein [Halanaerobium sp. DL-01]
MKIPFLSRDDVQENITKISVDEIETNPFQPRTDFDEDEIFELAASIDSYGIIQPITVRKTKEKYQLIAGERRLRAAVKAGKKEIPAVIRDFTDQEMAEIALVENLQRKDLNFMEEASAYARLLDEFNLTQQELADKVGKSQSTVANKVRLLNLPESVREKMKIPFLSERHARALLKLESEKEQLSILKVVTKKELTVRETERLIKDHLKKDKTERKKNIKRVYSDLRIFVNSLEKTISEIKDSGININVDKKENEDCIEFNIKLQKK